MTHIDSRNDTIDVCEKFPESLKHFFDSDSNAQSYYIFAGNMEYVEDNFLENKYESFKSGNKTLTEILEEFVLKNEDEWIFAIIQLTDIAEQPWITFNFAKPNFLNDKMINLGYSYTSIDSTNYKSKAQIRRHICSLIQTAFDFTDEQMRVISNNAKDYIANTKFEALQKMQSFIQDLKNGENFQHGYDDTRIKSLLNCKYTTKNSLEAVIVYLKLKVAQDFMFNLELSQLQNLTRNLIEENFQFDSKSDDTDLRLEVLELLKIFKKRNPAFFNDTVIKENLLSYVSNNINKYESEIKETSKLFLVESRQNENFERLYTYLELRIDFLILISDLVPDVVKVEIFDEVLKQLWNSERIEIKQNHDFEQLKLQYKKLVGGNFVKNAFNQSDMPSYIYNAIDVKKILKYLLKENTVNLAQIVCESLQDVKVTLQNFVKNKLVTLVAIKISGKHWISLVLFEHANNVNILYKDPLGANNYVREKSALKYLLKENLGDKIIFKCNENIEQLDESASGILAIANLKIILKQISKKSGESFLEGFENFSSFATQEDANRLRKFDFPDAYLASICDDESEINTLNDLEILLFEKSGKNIDVAEMFYESQTDETKIKLSRLQKKSNILADKIERMQQIQGLDNPKNKNIEKLIILLNDKVQYVSKSKEVTLCSETLDYLINFTESSKNDDLIISTINIILTTVNHITNERKITFMEKILSKLNIAKQHESLIVELLKKLDLNNPMTQQLNLISYITDVLIYSEDEKNRNSALEILQGVTFENLANEVQNLLNLEEQINDDDFLIKCLNQIESDGKLTLNVFNKIKENTFHCNFLWSDSVLTGKIIKYIVKKDIQKLPKSFVNSFIEYFQELKVSDKVKEFEGNDSISKTFIKYNIVQLSDIYFWTWADSLKFTEDLLDIIKFEININHTLNISDTMLENLFLFSIENDYAANLLNLAKYESSFTSFLNKDLTKDTKEKLINELITHDGLSIQKKINLLTSIIKLSEEFGSKCFEVLVGLIKSNPYENVVVDLKELAPFIPYHNLNSREWIRILKSKDNTDGLSTIFSVIIQQISFLSKDLDYNESIESYILLLKGLTETKSINFTTNNLNSLLKLAFTSSSRKIREEIMQLLGNEEQYIGYASEIQISVIKSLQNLLNLKSNDNEYFLENIVEYIQGKVILDNDQIMSLIEILFNSTENQNYITALLDEVDETQGLNENVNLLIENFLKDNYVHLVNHNFVNIILRNRYYITSNNYKEIRNLFEDAMLQSINQENLIFFATEKDDYTLNEETMFKLTKHLQYAQVDFNIKLLGIEIISNYCTRFKNSEFKLSEEILITLKRLALETGNAKKDLELNKKALLIILEIFVNHENSDDVLIFLKKYFNDNIRLKILEISKTENSNLGLTFLTDYINNNTDYKLTFNLIITLTEYLEIENNFDTSIFQNELPGIWRSILIQNTLLFRINKIRHLDEEELKYFYQFLNLVHDVTNKFEDVLYAILGIQQQYALDLFEVNNILYLLHFGGKFIEEFIKNLESDPVLPLTNLFWKTELNVDSELDAYANDKINTLSKYIVRYRIKNIAVLLKKLNDENNDELTLIQKLIMFFGILHRSDYSIETIHDFIEHEIYANTTTEDWSLKFHKKLVTKELRKIKVLKPHLMEIKDSPLFDNLDGILARVLAHNKLCSDKPTLSYEFITSLINKLETEDGVTDIYHCLNIMYDYVLTERDVDKSGRTLLSIFDKPNTGDWTKEIHKLAIYKTFQDSSKLKSLDLLQTEILGMNETNNELKNLKEQYNLVLQTYESSSVFFPVFKVTDLSKVNESLEQKDSEENKLIILKFKATYQQNAEIIKNYIQIVQNKKIQETFETSITAYNLAETFFNKENYEEAIQKFNEAYKIVSKLIKELNDECVPINKWDKQNILQWSNLVKNTPNKANQYEKLAVIKRAMEINDAMKIIPRDIQMMSVITLLNAQNARGRLLQINTGEGKTFTVAMFAVIKALEHPSHQVDIITTSPELAQPQSEQLKSFFELFGLTVSHNGVNSPIDIEQRYQENIVYGAVGDFQGDILRDEYHKLGTRNGRACNVAIVDEVDSMLIDGKTHIVMLSSPMPDMDHLEPLLTAVWTQLVLVSESLIEQDENLIYRETRSVPNDKGEITETEFVDTILPKGQTKFEVLLQTTEDHIRKMLREYIPYTKEKHIPEEYPKLPIPKHLIDFVDYQIVNWIKSGINAMYKYELDKHYILKDNFYIAPVDSSNTGIVQPNMLWSEGLHQFLQIKHGTKLTPESITTNSISNVAFFKRYGSNLYGLTGTLGSQNSKELLERQYNVDSVIIPSFKEKRYKALEPIVTNTEDNWYKEIVESCLNKLYNGRGVLVITKYIREVEKLREIFENQYNYDSNKIKEYKTGNDSKSVMNQLKSGEIILATNIAGRGTDIKPSQEIEVNGGLHVCITFLPNNQRVEDQNIGRTSRTGNRGTSQFIILNKDKLNLNYLRQLRNNAEKEDLIKSELEIKKVTAKDFWFKCFCDLLSEIFPELKIINDKNKKPIEIRAVEERFGLWLKFQDKYLNHPETEIKEIELNEIFQNFKKSIFNDRKIGNLIKNPAFFILKGNKFLGNGYNVQNAVEAIKEYTNAIDLDDYFGVHAYYNRGCARIVAYGEDRSNYEEELKLAVIDFRKAKDIIENHLEPLLNIVQNASYGKCLSEQIQHKLALYSTQKNAIETAIGQGVGAAKKQIQELNNRIEDGERDNKVINLIEPLIHSLRSKIASPINIKGILNLIDNLVINCNTNLKIEEKEIIQNVKKKLDKVLNSYINDELIDTYKSNKDNELNRLSIYSKELKYSLNILNKQFKAVEEKITEKINSIKKAATKEDKSILQKILDEKQEDANEIKATILKKEKFLNEVNEEIILVGLNESTTFNIENEILKLKKLREVLNQLDRKQRAVIQSQINSFYKGNNPKNENNQRKIDNIDIGVIGIAQKNDNYVKISFKSFVDSLPEDEDPKLFITETEEYRANGFIGSFEIEELKPIDWWSVIGLAIIGLVQLVAGALLVVLTAGFAASVGTGLLSEGVSDLITAVKDGIITRSFDWASWGIQKAISFVVSLVCAGLTTIKNAIKAAMTTAKTAASIVTSSVKSAWKLAAKSIGIALAQGIAQECATQLVDYGVNKALIPNIEQEITTRIKGPMEQILLKNSKVKKMLKLDIKNRNKKFETLIKVKALSLLSPKDKENNEVFQIFNSIVKGVVSAQHKGFKAAYVIYEGLTAIQEIVNFLPKFEEALNDVIDSIYIEHNIETKIEDSNKLGNNLKQKSNMKQTEFILHGSESADELNGLLAKTVAAKMCDIISRRIIKPSTDFVIDIGIDKAFKKVEKQHQENISNRREFKAKLKQEKPNQSNPEDEGNYLKFTKNEDTNEIFKEDKLARNIKEQKQRYEEGIDPIPPADINDIQLFSSHEKRCIKVQLENGCWGTIGQEFESKDKPALYVFCTNTVNEYGITHFSGPNPETTQKQTYSCVAAALASQTQKYDGEIAAIMNVKGRKIQKDVFGVDWSIDGDPMIQMKQFQDQLKAEAIAKRCGGIDVGNIRKDKTSKNPNDVIITIYRGEDNNELWEEGFTKGIKAKTPNDFNTPEIKHLADTQTETSYISFSSDPAISGKFSKREELFKVEIEAELVWKETARYKGDGTLITDYENIPVKGRLGHDIRDCTHKSHLESRLNSVKNKSNKTFYRKERVIPNPDIIKSAIDNKEVLIRNFIDSKYVSKHDPQNKETKDEKYKPKKKK